MAWRHRVAGLVDESDRAGLAPVVRRFALANGGAIAFWTVVAFALLDRPVVAALGVVAVVGLLGIAALAARSATGAAAAVAAWIWILAFTHLLLVGGEPTATIGSFLLAIVAAGLLVGPRAAVLASALTAVAGASVAWLGDAGRLTPLSPPASHSAEWWFSVSAVVTLPLLIVDSRGRLRAAERELKEAERRYRLVAENSRDLIWLSEDGVLRYVSPACERITGWTAAESLARGADFAWLTPDSAQVVSTLLGRAATSGESHARYEAEHVRKDGGTTWCEVEVSFLRDARGRVRGLLGVTRDVSQRRRAERERESLSAELVQAQKMEVVGRVAAGVAHDLNNQLTVILAGLELASEGPAELRGEAQKDALEAAQSAAALTRQLQLFSRRAPASQQPFDLNGVVRRLERTLRRVLGADVLLSVSPSAAPALVRADEAQIEQALLNLAVNARDAMPGGGRLAIEVGAAPGGGAWRLRVIDAGTGIDEASRPHIFEPFFTTKPPGRGTGLGLSMVRRFVEESGGSVRFESELGRGTTFEIELPRWSGALAPDREDESEAAAPLRSARILVVDDSAEVRRLIARTLAADGHAVLEAASPAQALARGRPAIDLLVTDVVMPGMRGPELAAMLRRGRPGLPVLYVTGYASDAFDVSGDARAWVLWKPFKMRDLRRAVRQALEPGGRTG